MGTKILSIDTIVEQVDATREVVTIEHYTKEVTTDVVTLTINKHDFHDIAWLGHKDSRHIDNAGQEALEKMWTAFKEYEDITKS